MFAVVLLTGTGLWVELNHRRQFTVLSCEPEWTVTPVGINFINTCAAILAQVVRTVVHIIGTVLTGITSRTNALIMSEVVDTLAVVFAGIVLFVTELDLRFAVFAAKTGHTFAPIGLDFVDTRGVVLAFVGNTVIGVSLASVAFKTWWVVIKLT